MTIWTKPSGNFPTSCSCTRGTIRSSWDTNGGSWWHLQDQGVTPPMLLLARNGCWYSRSFKNLSLLPTTPQRRLSSTNSAVILIPAYRAKPMCPCWPFWPFEDHWQWKEIYFVCDWRIHEANTVADAIFSKWFCCFGMPLDLITDQGKEFCAQLSDNLIKRLGTNHLTTSPHHPNATAK